MLEKVDVSVQITSLRPKVKQAIVCLIHHLTREVAKCEKRKGGNVGKFQKKAETYRKEILLLKEVNIDSVSRYALTMDFNEREKLLGDPSLPVDKRVIVKLATTKSVVSHIESFRAAHSDWRSSLPKLLMSLGTKSKKKESSENANHNLEENQETLEEEYSDSDDASQSSNNKKMKNTVGKMKKKSNLNRSPEFKDDRKFDIKGNQKNSGEEYAGSDKSSPTSNKKIGDVVKLKVKSTLSKSHKCKDDSKDNVNKDDINHDDDDDSVDYNSVSESEYGSSSDDDNEDDGDYDDDDDENDNGVSSDEDQEEASDNQSESQQEGEISDKRLERTSVSRKKNFTPIAQVSQFAEVRRFADLLLDEEQEKHRKVQDLHQSSSISSNGDPAEEDTFFMTGENSFLKTAVVNQDEQSSLSSNKSSAKPSDESVTQWSIDGKMLKGNRSQRRDKFLGRVVGKKEWHAKKGKQSRERGDSMLFHPKHAGGLHLEKEYNSDKNRSRNQNVSDVPSNSSNAGKLHPSWQAKRQQKNSIHSFQGKKIKFDDVSENEVGSRKGLVKVTENSDSSTADKLHPSWQAKRQQKISIHSFEGKKIKFDDDD